MATYFVYICQEIFDRTELATYWELIGPTLKGFSAKNIAAIRRSSS